MAKYTLSLDTQTEEVSVEKDGVAVSDKINSISMGFYSDGEKTYRYLSYEITDSNGDQVSRRVMLDNSGCRCENVRAGLTVEAGMRICQPSISEVVTKALTK